jgi:hypothetical protein
MIGIIEPRLLRYKRDIVNLHRNEVYLSVYKQDTLKTQVKIVDKVNRTLSHIQSLIDLEERNELREDMQTKLDEVEELAFTLEAFAINYDIIDCIEKNDDEIIACITNPDGSIDKSYIKKLILYAKNNAHFIGCFIDVLDTIKYVFNSYFDILKKKYNLIIPKITNTKLKHSYYLSSKYSIELKRILNFILLELTLSQTNQQP